MAANIVYPTSLEYWLQDKGLPYRSPLYYMNPDDFPNRKGISSIVDYLNFTRPVHIGIPKEICNRPTKEIIYHYLPTLLPSGSFTPVCDLLNISSPEYTFLQAALNLPIHKLVRLANDLCAMYLIDSDSDTFQRNRDPVTSVESIKCFLDRAKGLKGVQLARQAITYALDNSNSPKESQLATLARLRGVHGGYGTSGQILNLNVTLSKKGAEYYGRSTCCCDMVWPKEKIVLEYDSNLTHLTREQHAIDKSRATALTMSGYQVISVTADKVSSFHKIEDLFWGLRRMLGLKAGEAEREKHYEKRWKVVHEIMGLNDTK